MLIVAIMCCLPAQAQLGGLINKGKNALNKAKEVKEKVDEGIKKVNGDVDFYYMNAYKGFYRSKNGKIVFEDRHKEGKQSGKNICYTIEKNGEVKYDDGSKVGTLFDGGVISCHNSSTQLTVTANGDVMMDGEAIGYIDNAGGVSLLGKSIGRAPGIDKQVAAYIFFGILNDKQGIVTAIAQYKEEKLRAEEARRQAEEARLKAAEEAKARQATASANPTNSNKTSTKQASTNNTAKPKKVQEWTIEKGGSRCGYVDANGVVYNWAHNKIGQLPKGSGDIKDGSGSTIGRISMGDIYKGSTLVATVSSGGSISVPGSNATVAEVHAGGRIDMSKDSKTLGYCDVRPYEWAVAIIFCDIFRF